jgi:hypothetical protein
MNLTPFNNPGEHAYLRNKKESFIMQSQRSSYRIGAILSLLGGALVMFSWFFLPMVFGNGGGSFTPTSEWTVVNFYYEYFNKAAAVLLTLPLLSVLFILGTSAASFFRELSPRIVTWRRIAAIAGLIIQGPVGFIGGFLYAFGFAFGAGYWLVLLGFIIISVGAFLNGPLHGGIDRRSL